MVAKRLRERVNQRRRRNNAASGCRGWAKETPLDDGAVGTLCTSSSVKREAESVERSLEERG